MQIDGGTTFILFVTSFATFVIFFIHRDAYKTFFVIAILAALIYTQYKQQTKMATRTNARSKFMNKLKVDIRGREYVFENLFFVHKPPRELKYIMMDSELVEVLYQLRFLYVYDKETLLQIAILLEIFLKTHFNIMLGKYNAPLFQQPMFDLAKEILNAMYSLYFSLPTISTVHDLGNVHDYIYERITRIQAITTKYIQIIHNKHGGYDIHDSTHSDPTPSSNMIL